MRIKIIYEDDNILVIDKPAGVVVFSDEEENSVIKILLNEHPKLKSVGESPRFGMVHRLDKDTTGILLIAKNNQSLFFLQKQFKDRKVVKKYFALVVGEIKKEKGIIKTLIGRSPKDRTKQRVFSLFEMKEGRREAITEYRVLKYFSNGNKKYTLLEVGIKTGRRHQIRVHLSSLGYPIVGDKVYKFRKQKEEIKRHFLHSGFLKIELLDNGTKEFVSDIPEDLNIFLSSLNEYFR